MEGAILTAVILAALLRVEMQMNLFRLPIVGLLILTSSILQAATGVPQHETFQIESRHLRELRTINVYLPPESAGTSGRPVLYMPDGGVAEDFPHVAATVDAGIREGRLAPMLVVGIENTQRRRDLTGPTQVDSDKQIAPVVGGSAAFRAFIADELVPEIERRYRTGPSRGIIGESLAGLFIVETLFEQAKLFDTYIALSPSLWWNNAALTRSAAARLSGLKGLNARVYIAWADEPNIGPYAEILDATIREAALSRLQWTAAPRPDLNHGNIYLTLEKSAIGSMYPAGKTKTETY